MVNILLTYIKLQIYIYLYFTTNNILIGIADLIILKKTIKEEGCKRKFTSAKNIIDEVRIIIYYSNIYIYIYIY